MTVGDTIPRRSLDITHDRLVLNVGATWDFFPGHYDKEYAQASGHKANFANTSVFLGFADRVILEWAGPRARIARRKLTMIAPVYAGETMVAAGLVIACREHAGRPLVDVELEIRNDERRCAHATATVELPTEEEG